MNERTSAPWPRTVDTAVRLLLSWLPEKDKDVLKSTAEEDLMRFHHGWGMGIRNGFGLWADNRALLASCKTLGGPGCAHPDEASRVVIKAVWNRLNGLPFDHHQRTVSDIYRCEACGGEAQLDRWHEDEPVPPTHPECRECTRKSSAEYIKQQEETRRNNAVANQKFDRARQLGERVHDAAVAAQMTHSRLHERHGHSDDSRLLDVVRVLYDSDAWFRSLWDEAKGERPNDRHLGWLRMWTP